MGAVVDPDIQVVRDFVLDDVARWNEPLIRSLFSGQSSGEILRLQVPRESAEDRWIWTKDSTGCFSVKSLVMAKQSRRASAIRLLESGSWSKLWKFKLQDR